MFGCLSGRAVRIHNTSRPLKDRKSTQKNPTLENTVGGGSGISINITIESGVDDAPIQFCSPLSPSPIGKGRDNQLSPEPLQRQDSVQDILQKYSIRKMSHQTGTRQLRGVDKDHLEWTQRTLAQIEAERRQGLAMLRAKLQQRKAAKIVNAGMPMAREATTILLDKVKSKKGSRHSSNSTDIDFKFYSFAENWSEFAKVWVSEEVQDCVDVMVERWISCNARLHDDWCKGQPLWQLTRVDVMPHYSCDRVMEWMLNHPSIASHYLNEHDLCNPLIDEEFEGFLDEVENPFRQQVLAVHKYELRIPALKASEVPHNPRRRSSGGVNVNDAAAVAQWLENEKSGCSNHEAAKDLKPIDVLLRIGKSYSAEVFKTVADQLFPNATNYIVPDTAGSSAVVVDQGKNYYIIFDLFGYASACSKLVKDHLAELDEPMTSTTREFNRKDIPLPWPPKRKNLNAELEGLWSHLRT